MVAAESDRRVHAAATEVHPDVLRRRKDARPEQGEPNDREFVDHDTTPRSERRANP